MRRLRRGAGAGLGTMATLLLVLPALAPATAGAPANAGAPAPRTQDAQAIFDRAVQDFAAGKFEESAAAFDRVAEMQPAYAPQLWQRGIALYYVGRYQDCREQFESHRTVNPNDVENAAWHFLCVARGESAEAALENILPVGFDSRSPMLEIYRMFLGELSPEQVLEFAGEPARARFYAHLYIGLYGEARGQAELARASIARAADDRFAAEGGYMYVVARVHHDWLARR